MVEVPANISIASARLPQTYEHAKQALTACSNIDECQQWADKAEALASYAKQADDDSLRRLADRIQARAVRRCGELLKQYDARGDHRRNDGTVISSQRQAATDAGMSERQRVTAVRVANVPADKFEEWVESDAPPTVTKLAEAGKATRPAPPPAPPPPEGFREATRLLGSVQRFAEFCAANDPLLVAGGVLPAEVPELRRQVSTIDGWLDRFVVNLKG